MIEDRVVWLYRRWLGLVLPGDATSLDEVAQVFAEARAAAGARGWLAGVGYTAVAFVRAPLDGAIERLALSRGVLRRAWSGVGTDLRVALRSSRKRPLLAVLAMLSLTVGIGLNAILYTAVDALLFTPLAVPAPDRLVRIFDPATRRTLRSAVPVDVVEALDREARAFQGVAGAERARVALASGDDARLIAAERVTSGYFRTMGVAPARGRTLERADAVAGAEPVVVVSSRLLAELGAAAGTGGIVRINEAPHRVVGVAPAAFPGTRFLSPVDVWLPLPSAASATVEALGRLRPGVDRKTAESELRRVIAGLPPPATGPRGRAASGDGWYLLGEREGLINPAMPQLVDIGAGLALGGFLLLLLIACANTGGILLARTAARSEEIALRRALGASRSRLTRQLMIETAALVVPATALGALAAGLAGPAFEALVPPLAGLALDFSPDLRLVVFLSLIAAAGTVLATALPLATALRHDRRVPTGGRGAVGGVRRALDGVIVGQVALAAVVLLTAGLFFRTWQWYRSADPGYATAGRVAVTLDGSLYGLDAATRDAFYRELAARLAARRDIGGVALAAGVTMGGPAVTVRGPGAAGESESVAANRVSADYFRTLDIPLERGRAFVEGDAGRPVAIVNTLLAERLWPGGDAVGRTLETVAGEALEVVGVAPVLRYAALAEPPRPFLYRPVAHRLEDPMTLVIRGEDETRALDAVRATIRELRPGFVPLAATTLEDRVAQDRLLARTGALLGGVAGGLSLLLAALGVYGSLAYSVRSRRAELGVRAALGARPARLFRAIALRAASLGGAGLIGGLVVGIALATLARDLLLGTGILDPGVLALVTGAVAIGLLLALAGPARQASRLDPAVALRAEER